MNPSFPRRRTALKALALPLAAAIDTAWAQSPAEVKVGLLAPLSGLYAQFGQEMRDAAEMSVDHLNAAGGVKALGGAKLKLVVVDCGDTVEKSTAAAQRMVAEHHDMVALSGAYLSSFTLATTEVTERAKLPTLTLSYSDLITSRGFRYVFQTSATAAAMAEMSLPVMLKLAASTGTTPKTVAIVTDNTGASVASVKPMREGLLKKMGLELLVDETFTPPLADATPLIQKVRAAKPDLLFALPTAISDAKLLLEKLNEFGLGQGKLPTVGFGIAMALPDMLKTMDAAQLEGLMLAVGSWPFKGHEKLVAEFKTRFKRPWMTQNGISTYADMQVIKGALETAGKADREAVATALHTTDFGPSTFYPGGRIKFDDKGLRVGAELTIVQWQKGVPITVYPTDFAVAPPIWVKK